MPIAEGITRRSSSNASCNFKRFELEAGSVRRIVAEQMAVGLERGYSNHSSLFPSETQLYRQTQEPISIRASLGGKLSIKGTIHVFTHLDDGTQHLWFRESFRGGKPGKNWHFSADGCAPANARAAVFIAERSAREKHVAEWGYGSETGWAKPVGQWFPGDV
jgi:hypothetical protein